VFPPGNRLSAVTPHSLARDEAIDYNEFPPVTAISRRRCTIREGRFNMRFRQISLAIALCCFALPAAGGLEEGKVYPFKSAVIKYRITGSLQEGTETLYIDDYGRKTRTERETVLTIMGRKRRESALEIDDGEHLYRIDLLRKTGERTTSYSKVAREMGKIMSPEQKKAMEDLGKEIVKGFTGEEKLKPTGRGVVLGRECVIYDVMGVKSWQWNSLALKTENPSLGNMVQEAVEIRIDAPIPADVFKPPPGIALTEGGRGVEAEAVMPRTPQR